MSKIEGYTEFAFASLTDTIAFESMLQDNVIEYHKREGKTAIRTYTTFYIKEEDCSKVNKLWDNSKNE